MVEQAVQERRGEDGVLVEDPGPVFIHSVGCHQRGASLVTMAEDVEQAVGAERDDWEVAQFVHLHEHESMTDETGYSVRPSSGLSRWRRSRRCWRPAGLTASMPTRTWSMCRSGATSIRPAGSVSSRRGCGPNASGTPAEIRLGAMSIDVPDWLTLL